MYNIKEEIQKRILVTQNFLCALCVFSLRNLRLNFFLAFL